MSDAPAEKKADESKPKKPLDLSLLLVIVNTLAVLGAAGFMAYTKLIFKRPPITEEQEREKIAKKKVPSTTLAPSVILLFQPQTLNLSADEAKPPAKLHFASIGFAIEVLDGTYKDFVEDSRPLILDKFSSIVGRKPYSDLVHVQGRYVLRGELVDAINEVLASKPGAPAAAKEGLISNVYFTTFLVQ